MGWCRSRVFCRETLDEIHARFNRREFIHPDPLEFLHHYDGLSDREVVGMVASALAYGRVQQILRSVAEVLRLLGESPSRFLLEHSSGALRRQFHGFRHRFTGGDQLAALLCGIKGLIEEHGSLRASFLRNYRTEDETVLPALNAFVNELSAASGGGLVMLLPLPEKGSACKRLNLFLRWMVRTDEVDPGGWHGVGADRLIVPLDTHMHRIGLDAGLTRRRQADMMTALDITRAFREIVPEDPVRYDFALTRLGIRGINE